MGKKSLKCIFLHSKNVAGGGLLLGEWKREEIAYKKGVIDSKSFLSQEVVTRFFVIVSYYIKWVTTLAHLILSSDLFTYNCSLSAVNQHISKYLT